MGTATIGLLHILNPSLVVLSGHLAPVYVDKVRTMIKTGNLLDATRTVVKAIKNVPTKVNALLLVKRANSYSFYN